VGTVTKLGITLGDPSGIGPEIVAAALGDDAGPVGVAAVAFQRLGVSLR